MKGIAVQRKKKGWTQRELAEKMRVTTNTIYRWESSHSIYEVDPGTAALKKMSKLFGCTIDELVDESNPTKSAGAGTPQDSN